MNNPKEISRESGRIFTSLLLPSWAARSQEDQDDYGVDYEIEVITLEDKATATIFKVQLKGTSIAKYDDSNQLTFSDASVQRFSYYINELDIPIIFVVCDTTSRDCYWIRVQGNHQLELALKAAVAKDQDTFTIKLSPRQKLCKTEQCAESLLDDVECASQAITLRQLRAISLTAVQEHFSRSNNKTEDENQFRLFAGLAAMSSIHEMAENNNYEDACRKAKSLFESDGERPAVRLLAGQMFADMYSTILHNQGAPGADIKAAAFTLSVSFRIVQIARSNGWDNRLKRFARIYMRSTRMNHDCHLALALAFSEQAQCRHNDPLLRSVTQLKRLQHSKRIAKDFIKLRNAVSSSGEKGYYSIIPFAVIEMSEGISPFIYALKTMNHSDLAEAYIEVLSDLMPECVSISRRICNEDQTAQILKSLGIAFIQLGYGHGSPTTDDLYTRYDKILEALAHESHANAVRADILKIHDKMQLKPKQSLQWTLDDSRKMYANLASSLGINLDDPNDSTAELVNIGLEDLDPTRVLINCQLMHVMTTSFGMAAKLLNLPTAGFKKIVCLKHGHSVEALRLDSAYDKFSRASAMQGNQICCTNCPDKVPHPEEWRWSAEWNQDQAIRYKQFCDKRKNQS